MRKLMTFSALALAALAFAAPQLAAQAPAPAAPVKLPPAAGPLAVYTTLLAPGWDTVGSTAAIEPSSDVGSATRKPIRVEGQVGQTLVIHHAPMTSGYRRLTFLIQAAPAGAGQVQVLALLGGKPLNAAGKMEPLKPGGWTKVDMPLANLGAEGVAFDSIEFVAAGPAPVPVYYVSDVTLDVK